MVRELCKYEVGSKDNGQTMQETRTIYDVDAWNMQATRKIPVKTMAATTVS